jgi:RimJ/RimL family protein N-acetyltransferase
LLETERLVLRRPRLEDVGFATRYLGDPCVMRFLGGRTAPPDAWPQVVQTWIDRWEASGLGYFVVVRREDGTFVGRVGINTWDPQTWQRASAGERELAWMLDRACWGRGYATEAARAVRDWVRTEHGVLRLISLISPDNVRSARVAERLGAAPGEAIPDLEGGGPHVVWVHP